MAGALLLEALHLLLEMVEAVARAMVVMDRMSPHRPKHSTKRTTGRWPWCRLHHLHHRHHR